MAVFVKLKAQPGKREEVKELWEKHVKPHQESTPEILSCCYCYAMEDEDTICAFELLSGPSAAEAAMNSEWFSAYQEALRPLLAGPPEATAASLIWSKGIAK
jgi:quinol monooxygenase YgiN